MTTKVYFNRDPSAVEDKWSKLRAGDWFKWGNKLYLVLEDPKNGRVEVFRIQGDACLAQNELTFFDMSDSSNSMEILKNVTITY